MKKTWVAISLAIAAFAVMAGALIHMHIENNKVKTMLVDTLSCYAEYVIEKNDGRNDGVYTAEAEELLQVWEKMMDIVEAESITKTVEEDSES